jgi:hypothetical protein
MVAIEEILMRKISEKVMWKLQYGFRSCHNRVIQSIQWWHDRGKQILYTSIQKSTETGFSLKIEFLFWYMFSFNLQFTFILQCSLKSESVEVVVTVWINSSHFSG